jgi:hypothetical protein
MVALQLLTYMVRIWNQKVNKENQTHIPVIIPMVICHGETKWKIESMFSDLILNFDTLPEEVKQLIPTTATSSMIYRSFRMKISRERQN